MPAITYSRPGRQKEIIFSSDHILILGRGKNTEVHVPEDLARSWRAKFRPEKGDTLLIEDDGFGSIKRGEKKVRTARVTRPAIFRTVFSLVLI